MLKIETIATTITARTLIPGQCNTGRLQRAAGSGGPLHCGTRHGLTARLYSNVRYIFTFVDKTADKALEIGYYDPYDHPIRDIRLAAMDSTVSSHKRGGLELDLARSRTRAGVSLEAIAHRTKIGLRFLQAIEAEQFEKLPGGIFSTSYLRQYAEAVGYDVEALVAFYNKKMNLPDSVSKPPQRENGGRRLLDRWLRTASPAPR